MKNIFEKTEAFQKWFSRLRDMKVRVRILERITAAELGNFGDCAPVGDGVFEMRIHFGPGYRVYYARKGDIVYLLLAGGDKKTQRGDIRRARLLWKNFKGGARG